jgi:hypothetical protein
MDQKLVVHADQHRAMASRRRTAWPLPALGQGQIADTLTECPKISQAGSREAAENGGRIIVILDKTELPPVREEHVNPSLLLLATF